MTPRTRVFGCALGMIVLTTFSSAKALAERKESAERRVPPVRTMYNDAFAREQAVRPALAAPDRAPAVLDDVRSVIARYESVVRHYPASAYSDNALWQAARLALDAFAAFKDRKDRDAAVRLLRRLEASFPTSRLAKQVPAELQQLGEPPTAATPSTMQVAATVGERPRVATIRDIRRSVLPDAVRVVIELDAEVSFHEERIPDPWRVFVDLPGTRATATLVDQTIRFESDGDIVRQIRIGRHPNSTTRVVLDATGVSSYSVYPLYSPYRLVIDCVRAAVVRAPATFPTQVRAATDIKPAPARVPEPPLLTARSSTSAWLRRAPGNTPQHTMPIADAHTAEAELPPPAPVVSPPMARPPELPSAPAVRNSTGGFSIARQLGLGVSRIVIDPGHGGHDPGAQARGVVEAELVLDVALRLEKLLQKTAGVEVILTRRTDEFIPLQERTAIANREGADLFLSIHANASPTAQARGIETYFLNFASNLSAAAVAARENAASGQTMGALPDIVKSIALNNKLDESRDFATAVQHAMVERLRPSNKLLKDLGVKQAPFVVLIGAAMPSVLAEISFVTNPQEAKLLKNGGYRQKIAEALFNAIRKYQTSLKHPTAVASQ